MAIETGDQVPPGVQRVRDVGFEFGVATFADSDRLDTGYNPDGEHADGRWAHVHLMWCEATTTRMPKLRVGWVALIP